MESAPAPAPRAGTVYGDTLGNFWFPPPSSTVADQVDQLFYLILYISLFFFVLIIGVMTAFVIRYRRRTGASAMKTATHSGLLEATWTVVPAALLLVIFSEGFLGYMRMRTPPDNTYEVQVVAKKWNWAFLYPNGHVDNHLHVPVDRPVQLVMSSDDVIHSLFVPSFRIKMDVVPGRYTKTWFQATRPGTYMLYCAEYCGTQHSAMVADVVVHPSGEFERWLEDAANFLERMTPVEAGELLYQRRGCAQCHSTDGSAKVGPTFRGTFGTQQPLAAGGSATVDENYIRESILDPQAQIRAGYKPVMPTYRGQLKDAEISALIEFIKSLQAAPAAQ